MNSPQRMMDEQSFRVFYEATQKNLWAYIRRVTGDEMLAGDLAQDAYLRFYNSRGVDLDGTKQKSYLYRIATNLIYDHWRRNKRTKEWNDDQKGSISSDREDELINQHDMGLAFEQLTPQQRSLLWLAYVDEYEHKEMAKILKLNEKSIRVLLFRAKNRLVNILKKLDIKMEIF